jgi:hypothetical protein
MSVLKRIANIVVGNAASGAGAVIGVRLGHDAYNWVKSGKATKAVKKLANSAADATEEMLGTTTEEAALPRRIGRSEEQTSDRAQVKCERCGEPALVRVGAGDIIVTCPACEARFWVDTDELAGKTARR